MPPLPLDPRISQSHPQPHPQPSTTYLDLHPLSARNSQAYTQLTTLPSTYNYSPHISPGTIVGIVLGSVLGFLLVLYLLYLALTSGRKFSPSTTTGASTILTGSGSGTTSSTSSAPGEVIVEEHLSSRSPRSHRSARRYAKRGKGRRVRREEEIIEEGYIPPTMHAGGAGAVHPPRSKHHLRHHGQHPEMVESVVSSERSDMVTVMEEHSSVEGGPPRRARSGRKGYRAVDLDAVEGLSVDGSLRS